MSLLTQLQALIAVQGAYAKETRRRANERIFHLGGQFLLDPNERNTFGALGPTDNTNNQDVGNSGAGTMGWAAGGISYPWDCRLVEFRCRKFRVNNVDSEAFGFFIAHFTDTSGVTTARPFTALLDEVGDNGGVGPREPANTSPDDTGVITINSGIIPAGDTITFGVDSPTAIGTNRWVQIMDGYLLFDRL